MVSWQVQDTAFQTHQETSMYTGDQIPTTLSEPMSAISIKSIPLIEQLQAILCEHGCTCEDFNGYTLIVLPQGSFKQELYPRMNITERYLTTLPDGMQFVESFDYIRRLSMIFSVMPGM